MRLLGKVLTFRQLALSFPQAVLSCLYLRACLSRQFPTPQKEAEEEEEFLREQARYEEEARKAQEF